jgi:hypothetical protein
MFADLLKVLVSGLSLWNTKESRKYLDRAMALEREWNEEFNRPLDIRSDAELDRILLELRVLGRAFHSAVGAANVAPQPGSSGG